MKKNRKTLPAPFAALTKDARFAGTYEVLVPIEGRVRPQRVPLQFEDSRKGPSLNSQSRRKGSDHRDRRERTDLVCSKIDA